MGRLTPLARELRRNQTDAEKQLWARLRNRRLNGWRFRRQVPIGAYIADFLCPDAWLIVELDGGQHGSDAGMQMDCRRTVELELQPISFFVSGTTRSWAPPMRYAKQFYEHCGAKVIAETHPHPNPLPDGEREMTTRDKPAFCA